MTTAHYVKSDCNTMVGDYMDDERRTNIQVKVGTRERLAQLGRKGQTYDDIINDLIDKVTE